MKRNNLKQPLLFVPFLLVLCVCDSARGHLPPGVVASFYYNEQGHVIRQEKDTNGDGKIDLWIYYDKDGKVERVEKDVNFDGRPDIWIFYEGGQPKKQEVSSNQDGWVDAWLYFNGRISARYYFSDGKLTKEEKVADEAPWATSEPFFQSKKN